MRVVLATGNPGKVSELQALLDELGVEVVPQAFYYVPAAAETGTTFVENAIIKARNACEHTGLPAVADDSGLEVDGLGGAPGVHSARWAGDDADDAANNARLRDELLDVPPAERGARFRCVLVYLRHAADPAPVIAEGVWPGEVIETPRGRRGFGYDPHFLVPQLERTAAELDAVTKNRLSHRGQALHQLRAALGREWGMPA